MLSCTFTVFHKCRWKCYTCRIYIALICTLKIPIPTHNHSRQSLEAIKSTHLYGLHTYIRITLTMYVAKFCDFPTAHRTVEEQSTHKQNFLLQIFSGASGNIALWDEEKEESKHEEYQCSWHVHIYITHWHTHNTHLPHTHNTHSKHTHPHPHPLKEIPLTQRCSLL